MIKRILSYLAVILVVGFLTGCFSDTKSKPLSNRDLQTLLIQQSEVPPDWHLEYSGSKSEDVTAPDVIANRGVSYAKPVRDKFYTQFDRINHNTSAFKQEENAIKTFKRYYDYLLDINDPIIELPQKYSYTSSVADELKIMYFPVEGYVQPSDKSEDYVPNSIVGYHYHVLARYGNVISEFSATIEDEEKTGIKAGEANILTWVQVEKLLRLIDEKFRRAGF